MSGSESMSQNLTWASEMEALSNTSGSSLNKSKEESSEREINLRFIEEKNGKKFDHLVETEQIRPPYKRHCSHVEEDEQRVSAERCSSTEEARNGHATANERRPHRQPQQQQTQKKDGSRKRVRRNSNVSSADSATSRGNDKLETDVAILERRQKQIDYGKNTLSYERYVKLVPRGTRTANHPRTPDRRQKYSRRAFDGLIRKWRRQLHEFDPQSNGDNAEAADTDTDSDSSSD